jgi:hypothetical protein
MNNTLLNDWMTPEFDGLVQKNPGFDNLEIQFLQIVEKAWLHGFTLSPSVTKQQHYEEISNVLHVNRKEIEEVSAKVGEDYFFAVLRDAPLEFTPKPDDFLGANADIRLDTNSTCGTCNCGTNSTCGTCNCGTNSSCGTCIC